MRKERSDGKQKNVNPACFLKWRILNTEMHALFHNQLYLGDRIRIDCYHFTKSWRERNVIFAKIKVKQICYVFLVHTYNTLHMMQHDISLYNGNKRDAFERKL